MTIKYALYYYTVNLKNPAIYSVYMINYNLLKNLNRFGY